MDESKGMKFGAPAAIVLAGLVIAAAIFLRGPSVSNPPAPGDQVAAMGLLAENIKPVGGDDRTRGSAEAPIQIIEYSDLECPFCKAFHRAAIRALEKYEATGKLSWTFRHFPLDSLHSKARAEAVAAECAYAQGGSAAFFAYIDRVFEITPSNNGLDLAELPKLATELKLDLAAFEACRQTEAPADLVEAHLQNALAIGADGTPFVILAEGDNYQPIFRTGIPAEASEDFKTIANDLTTLFQEEIAALR